MVTTSVLTNQKKARAIFTVAVSGPLSHDKTKAKTDSIRMILATDPTAGKPLRFHQQKCLRPAMKPSTVAETNSRLLQCNNSRNNCPICLSHSTTYAGLFSLTSLSRLLPCITTWGNSQSPTTDIERNEQTIKETNHKNYYLSQPPLNSISLFYHFHVFLVNANFTVIRVIS